MKPSAAVNMINSKPGFKAHLSNGRVVALHPDSKEWVTVEPNIKSVREFLDD